MEVVSHSLHAGYVRLLRGIRLKQARNMSCRLRNAFMLLLPVYKYAFFILEQDNGKT